MNHRIAALAAYLALVLVLAACETDRPAAPQLSEPLAAAPASPKAPAGQLPATSALLALQPNRPEVFNPAVQVPAGVTAAAMAIPKPKANPEELKEMEKAIHGDAPQAARDLWQKAVDAGQANPQDWDTQIGFYKKALAAYPDYTLAKYSLGTVYMLKGDALIDGRAYDESAKLLKAALDAGVKWRGLYNNYGTVLRKAGKADEAVKVLEEGLAHFPDSVTMLNNAAEAHMDLGNGKDAQRLLAKAKALSPDDSRTRSNLHKLNSVPSP